MCWQVENTKWILCCRKLVQYLRFLMYNICISINFNNPLKVCLSNKKYLITIQTCPTPIVKSIFLIEKPVNEFSKVIGVQNQLPITFCLDLVCNKTLMVRNSTPTHTNF